jgi:hypothetical protein
MAGEPGTFRRANESFLRVAYRVIGRRDLAATNGRRDRGPQKMSPDANAEAQGQGVGMPTPTRGNYPRSDVIATHFRRCAWRPCDLALGSNNCRFNSLNVVSIVKHGAGGRSAALM